MRDGPALVCRACWGTVDGGVVERCRCCPRGGEDLRFLVEPLLRCATTWKGTVAERAMRILGESRRETLPEPIEEKNR